ncbi:hypothetical protein [Mycobacterium innocens]|nr:MULTISPECIES: hypothetical protein [Mycobacterium]
MDHRSSAAIAVCGGGEQLAGHGDERALCDGGRSATEVFPTAAE